MISIQLIYVIVISVQEFGHLRQLLIHFLEHEDRDSKTLTDIKKHLKSVSEDIHARMIQYRTDGLYFEALYLSRRLFDLWGDCCQFQEFDVLPAHYDFNSMVSLCEKVGDFPAAELAQQEIVLNINQYPIPTPAMEGALLLAIRDLLQLYDQNRQRKLSSVHLTDGQELRFYLCRAAKLRKVHSEEPSFAKALQSLIHSMERQDDIITALRIAASLGHTMLLGLLLSMKAYPDTEAHDSTTALHIALRKGDTLSTRLLLGYGADPNAKDNYGNTGLHHVKIDHSGLVDLLLKHGANINLQNNMGETAVHLAVHNYAIGRLQTLLKHGADANIKNDRGDTAVHIAVRIGVENNGSNGATYNDQEEIVRLLLEAGADPHVR